jgi:RNA polymerase sigma-70 factor (ECF subfamily)
MHPAPFLREEGHESRVPGARRDCSPSAGVGNFSAARDTTLESRGVVKSDEDLMDDVRRGARGAFETLFGRYREPVWRFFRRRAADGGAAEELAQDTFVAVLEGAGRYQQRGSFRSYLFGIAFNVLQSERRRSARRPSVGIAVDPPSADAPPDAAIWVRDALLTLDEPEREILMLREYEQLSYQEIADVRGIPLNTVRSQLFRARGTMKTALEMKTSEATRLHHARR